MRRSFSHMTRSTLCAFMHLLFSMAIQMSQEGKAWLFIIYFHVSGYHQMHRYRYHSYIRRKEINKSTLNSSFPRSCVISIFFGAQYTMPKPEMLHLTVTQREKLFTALYLYKHKHLPSTLISLRLQQSMVLVFCA